jgi:hypothetical protein
LTSCSVVPAPALLAGGERHAVARRKRADQRARQLLHPTCCQIGDQSEQVGRLSQPRQRRALDLQEACTRPTGRQQRHRPTPRVESAQCVAQLGAEEVPSGADAPTMLHRHGKDLDASGVDNPGRLGVVE